MPPPRTRGCKQQRQVVEENGGAGDPPAFSVASYQYPVDAENGLVIMDTLSYIVRVVLLLFRGSGGPKTNGKTSFNLVSTAFVSILLPGLGHLSCGKIKKAIILYVASQVLLSIAIFVFLKAPFPYDIIISISLFASIYLYSIVDSVRIARNPANYLKLNPVYGYCIFIAVLTLHSSIIGPFLSKTIKEHYIQAFKIPTDTMLPTLLVGDMLLVDKHVYANQDAKRGDIIVYQSPEDAGRTLIRRIVGVPGEKIEVKNAKIYINGTLYAEPYGVNTDGMIENTERNTLVPFQIPANSYFVMGDNRDQMHDNKFWGIVERGSVYGKALKLYWSWDKSTNKVRWSRVGREIK